MNVLDDEVRSRMEERLALMRVLARLPHHAHTLIDTLMGADHSPAATIREVLDCNQRQAEQILITAIQVLTPDRQRDITREIDELETLLGHRQPAQE
ncbi:hypothetical protein [Phytoactinopolyspora limicola]|uniref:hypothetical protein n=1 Tax=Phytoactinopolyspora limicola TaxID=2715536 RepID=UPI00140A3694|nr:hypothetical protein [Phytoactinopolyspora limicola]